MNKLLGSVSPINVYVVKDTVTKVNCAPLAAPIAANQTIISASTGNIHRIMGISFYSAGASQFVFKSNNTTTLALYGLSAGGNINLPIADSGYFETLTGESLTIDVGTTAAYITVYYITYTP